MKRTQYFGKFLATALLLLVLLGFSMHAYGQNQCGGLAEFPGTTTAIHLPGNPNSYRVEAGYFPYVSPDQKLKACLFYVAYLQTNANNSSRPLSFLFNGGPGSASDWIDFGGLGPNVISFGRQGLTIPTSTQLTPNLHSLLPVTDLVFIDAVGTGLSRAVDDSDQGQFENFDRDADTFASLIAWYVDKSDRRVSPKYLIGESFGAARAIEVAAVLGLSSVKLSGLIFISGYFDSMTDTTDTGNDVPFATALPTFAMVARYHGRLSSRLEHRSETDVISEVKLFITTEYLPALAMGNEIPKALYDRIARRLAQYTGLTEDYSR